MIIIKLFRERHGLSLKLTDVIGAAALRLKSGLRCLDRRVLTRDSSDIVAQPHGGLRDSPGHEALQRHEVDTSAATPAAGGAPAKGGGAEEGSAASGAAAASSACSLVARAASRSFLTAAVSQRVYSPGIVPSCNQRPNCQIPT